jgi:hypothetical protein
LPTQLKSEGRLARGHGAVCKRQFRHWSLTSCRERLTLLRVISAKDLKTDDVPSVD